MEGSDAAQVLVVILSIFLALFLFLAVVLSVLLIKVTRQIQAVTNVAKDTADKVNGIMATASKAAAPAVAARYFAEMALKFFKNRK